MCSCVLSVASEQSSSDCVFKTQLLCLNIVVVYHHVKEHRQIRYFVLLTMQR